MLKLYAKLNRYLEININFFWRLIMKKVTNLKLHEEFKLYENMWEESRVALSENSSAIDEKRLYAEVQTTVERCLQRLKLDKYCEDSYDNSYDDGNAMQYELLWNFSKVPNKAKLQSILEKALHNINDTYNIYISVTVDDEVLMDEGYINLAVAYEIPHNMIESVEASSKLSEDAQNIADTPKTSTLEVYLGARQSNKIVDKKGIPHIEAYKELVKTIKSLSDKDMYDLDIWWTLDGKTPGDQEGDAVLYVDGATIAVESGADPDDCDNGYEGGIANPANRFVLPYACDPEDLGLPHYAYNFIESLLDVLTD